MTRAPSYHLGQGVCLGFGQSFVNVRAGRKAHVLAQFGKIGLNALLVFFTRFSICCQTSIRRLRPCLMFFSSNGGRHCSAIGCVCHGLSSRFFLWCLLGIHTVAMAAVSRNWKNPSDFHVIESAAL